jgi:hypothetical protein
MGLSCLATPAAIAMFPVRPHAAGGTGDRCRYLLAVRIALEAIKKRDDS